MRSLMALPSPLAKVGQTRIRLMKFRRTGVRGPMGFPFSNDLSAHAGGGPATGGEVV